MDRFTICALCDHFVEANNEPQAGITLAEFIHLDSGEKEHDHDAVPLRDSALPLHVWQDIRPDLFIPHRDGHIGPNSRFHVTRS